MAAGATLVFWSMLLVPDAAEVEAALRRVLAEGEYQTALPLRRPSVPSVEVEFTPPPRPREPDPPPRPAPPPEPAPAGDPAPARERPPARRQDAEDIRPAGETILWILASVLAAAVAVYVGRDILARRRAREALGEARKPARPAAHVEAPIPDWERLALAGRHAEAIHAILLQALRGIGAARAGLRPAWTSREILSLVKLEEAAHAALRSLVGLVEVTRFGGVPAREQEYRNAVAWLGTIGGAAR